MVAPGKSLRQGVHLPCSPRQAYDLLMTSRGHAALTGAKARISGRVDGLCSAYDGYCQARNVALEPGLMIVQAWRTKDWPEGWWSTVTWDFATAKGGGTRLTFTQTGIPQEDFETVRSGWARRYWDKLKVHGGQIP